MEDLHAHGRANDFGLGVGVELLKQANERAGGLVALSAIAKEVELACPKLRRSYYFMRQDNRIFLDYVRRDLLPDCPQVFGNRFWFDICMNRCDPEKWGAFVASHNPDTTVEDVKKWVGTPYPEIIVATERRDLLLSDNRPCLCMSMTLRPDGEIHHAYIGGTRSGFGNSDPVGRDSANVGVEIAHLFLSLTMPMIFPSLRSNERGTSI